MIDKIPPRDPNGQCFAILSIVGARLDPVEILPLFPVPAKKTVAAGSLPPLRGHLPPGVKVRRSVNGVCQFSSEGAVDEAQDISDHVSYMLSIIERNADKIVAVLRERGLTWDIACWFESEEVVEPTLTDRVRARAEALGIPVRLGSAGSVTGVVKIEPPDDITF